jgi:TusA-related sulfurtransferase
MRKRFLALLLPLAIVGVAVAGGVAFAGGTDCHGNTVAAHGHGEGSHCPLAKGVTKHATMTDDGAVVVLEGKDADAVKRIQEHLSEHQKGEGEECPGCPFGSEGVSATVKMTDKGGEISLTGSTPEAVKHVQEWAKKPAGACCGGGMKKAA